MVTLKWNRLFLILSLIMKELDANEISILKAFGVSLRIR